MERRHRGQSHQRLLGREGANSGLKQRGAGSIVFTSSFVGASNGGMAGMAAYAATKAGLVGLVRSLASEHAADGVRINSLLPGGAMTAAEDRVIPAFWASSPICT